MVRGSSWPDRIYGWLLLVYPKPFRERFGRGMRHAFARDERAARARGAAVYLWFWTATIWDAARFSIGERRAFVRHHAHTREQGGFTMMSRVTVDWRDAWRTLRATPVVTGIAILTIALAIGANSALFSILSALVLRPLPVRNPEQLVTLVNESWTHPIWEALHARRTQIAAGAFAWSIERFNLSAGAETEMHDGLFASGDFFEVLGVTAFRGRTFTAADDDRSKPAAGGPVAVISHALWQRRYGGADDVVGRTISIDRHAFTIIGVTPRGFFGPDVGRSADVFVPLASERLLRGKESALDIRDVWWLSVMFRLRDGQTIEAASAALHAVQPQIRDETVPSMWHPAEQGRYLEAPIALAPAVAGRSELRERYQQPLTIVMAVVGATLLIACGNIANLLLARAVARRRELSVRLALGASRLRLSGQVFAESAMLTSLGALGGIAIAYWGSRVLVGQLSIGSTRVALDLGLDWRVLAFTIAVAGAAAMLFGASSTLGLSGVSPQDVMHEQSRGVVGERKFPVRGALVVLQLSLSLALVVAAGLFTRTFVTLMSRDVGFDRRSVLIASIDLQRDAARGPARAALAERMRVAVGTLPAAAGAAISFTTPVFDRGWNTPIATTNPDVTGRERMSWVNAVSPDYFSTFGIRFVAGRDFEPGDSTGNTHVAIVNQTFARRFLAEPALGQSFRQGRDPEPFVVVGVVQDTVYRSLRSPMMPTMYVPFQNVGGSVLMSVRAASAAPLTLARDVVQVVQRDAPSASVTVRSLEQQVDASVSEERLVATTAAAFGGLALILAALGLYGVAAYTMSRRRTEIAIRMALGASPSGVVRMMLSRLGWMIAAGVAMGTMISVWAGKFIGALLYGLEPRDPLTLIAAAAVLSAVALVAGWLPARRAARVDPSTVLHER